MRRELTKAQAEYFKNTKVLANGGVPMAVFHGSKSRDFESFQYDPARQTGADYGEAYYFTNDYQSAKAYAYDDLADPRIKDFIAAKQALAEEYDGKAGYWDALDNLCVNGVTFKDYQRIVAEKDFEISGGEVHEVYLDMQRPFRINAHQQAFYDIYSKDLFDKVKAAGYDGIIAYDINDTAAGATRITDGYIVFKPEQIKSVGNLYPTNAKEFKDNSWDYLRQYGNEMPLMDRIQLGNYCLGKDLAREVQQREKTRNNKGLDSPGGR